MLRQVAWPIPLPPPSPPAWEPIVLRRFRVFTLTAAQPALDRIKINHPVCHAVAEVVWRMAEGTASDEEREASADDLHGVWEVVHEAMRQVFTPPIAALELTRLVNVLALLFSEPHGSARQLIVPQQVFSPGPIVPLLTPDETLDCCRLFRDIFGDRGAILSVPAFGESSWQPAWATDTAVSLVRTMYESREFSAMPILADALQDAGCDNDDVLSHCRDAKLTHVRGCWVVDLVLGKG
jgi:hypothetical protein